MSSTNVVPINPAAAPPDCIILDADASIMVGTSLRSWKGGIPITDRTDIAHLEGAGVPRKRYELIPEQPSPTPPGEELEVAA